MLGLIVGDPHSRYPALRELVSGPNLDADRMDYLLRDAYFTGVATGRYDAEQLVASLRVFDVDGKPAVGIDRRGVVALESFVMARYMMFASVYFHHTTRMFEHVLHEVLRELWPDPRALDPTSEFLRWDDFRVLDALDDAESAAARGAAQSRAHVTRLACGVQRRARSARLRGVRRRLCANASATRTCGPTRSRSCCTAFRSASATTARSGWAGAAASWTRASVSDLISKLSGKAYWRKLFVRKAGGPDDDSWLAAREICAGVIATL